MSNALYDKGRQGFLDGSIDWDTNTVKAFLLDAASYTPNLALDDNLDDVPVAARKGNSGGTADADAPTLGTKTVTNGVADAADVTFTAVPAGAALEFILIYASTGVEATSRLIALIDTATGLPVTPNGGNINVVWDNGTNRIFKL